MSTREDSKHTLFFASRLFAISLLLILTCQSLQAQTPAKDLTEQSLEDLMNIQVISVSKKEQKLSRAASAVFVITQDDIQRSGATNIPDLLRMVPGMNVAQINGSTWAVSARGFDFQYGNKLLVLIDGRAVYSPIFAGVYWNAQTIALNNIERIEVIRGPGATVWGANAVNGVINITTKKASDTQGGLLTEGGGSYEHEIGDVRYGGTIKDKTAYRVSLNGFTTTHFPSLTGQNGLDDWNTVRGGFRTDTKLSGKDSLTVEGDGYSGNGGAVANLIASLSPPVNGEFDLRNRFSGWDIVSRWDHTISSHSETSLQVYFDRSNIINASTSIGLNTYDIEFQHHVGWGTRQDFVWGVGYRLNSDFVPTTPELSFHPSSRNGELANSFVQDEIAMLPDRLYVTVGVKLDYNDYTGVGWQPSGRIAWIANPKNMFWAAVSRSLRTPSRTDRNVAINSAVEPGPGNVPILVTFNGNPNEQDEIANTFEAGYRTQLARQITLDGTVFYNDYDNLESIEPGTPFPSVNPPPFHIVAPLTFGNGLYGESHGLEASINWKLTDRWTLSPGYSLLMMHMHKIATSQDTTLITDNQGGFPNHQAQLRSRFDLPHQLQWNASVYFVDRVPAQAIPSYTRLDTNLIWRLRKRWSVSVVGQNLLKDHHEEYNNFDQSQQSSLIKRSAYTKIAWQF